MLLKNRQKWLRWIESIPTKRNKNKSFSRDDDFFWGELQKGLLYERLVAKILQDAGVPSIEIDSDRFQFREDIKESSKYSKEAKDLIIKGHNFEVKSRNIGFLSPETWPKGCRPIHIDTVSSINSKRFDVAGYILISQITGALIGISTKTREGWEISKGYDGVRNLRDSFYSASVDLFYDENQLISSLKRMGDKKPVNKSKQFKSVARR